MEIEKGMVKKKKKGKINIEKKEGMVEIEYEKEGKYVESVRIKNVKDLIYEEGMEVEWKDIGKIKVDVDYGGNL